MFSHSRSFVSCNAFNVYKISYQSRIRINRTYCEVFAASQGGQIRGLAICFEGTARNRRGETDSRVLRRLLNCLESKCKMSYNVETCRGLVLTTSFIGSLRARTGRLEVRYPVNIKNIS
jgi:hypothetical protein